MSHVGFDGFEGNSISAPLVFHSQASHTWKTKIVVLSEELRRRFRNMDVFHSWSARKEVVGRFLQKMKNSGYDQVTGEVIKSAVRKHHREKEGRKASPYTGAEKKSTGRRR